LAGGALPQGLNFDASGAISGTPTAVGPSTFTVRATDASGCSDTHEYTMNVLGQCPMLSITPGKLPKAQNFPSYSQFLSASGGRPPYTFSVASGQLPPQLSLFDSGQIIGMASIYDPFLTTNFAFGIEVMDANGCATTNAYTLMVVQGQLF